MAKAAWATAAPTKNAPYPHHSAKCSGASAAWITAAPADMAAAARWSDRFPTTVRLWFRDGREAVGIT